MPLDRLVLIMVIAVVAAGATVWLGAVGAAALQVPQIGWFVVLPVVAVAYICWRIIAERVQNDDDNHYDSIEK